MKEKLPLARLQPKYARSILGDYGITLEVYMQMLKAQDHRCWLCKIHEDDAMLATGRTAGLTIDHCHRTGNIRRLLCSRCNISIGYFRDDHEMIERVLAYLKEFSTLPLNEERHRFYKLAPRKPGLR